MATGRIIRPRTQEGWDLLVPNKKAPNFVLRPEYRRMLDAGFLYVGGDNALDLGGAKNTGGWVLGGDAEQAEDRSVKCDSDTSGTCIRTANTIAFSKAPRSLILHYKNLRTTTGSTNYFTYCGSFSNWSLYWYPSRSRIIINDGLNGVHGFDFNPIIGTDLVMVMTFDGVNGSGSRIFTSTGYEGVCSDDGASNTLGNTSVNDYLCFGGRDDSSGRSVNGILRCALLLNEELRPDLARALARDLYNNAFKPANDTPFLYSITGGATVTLSSPTATATGPTTATVGCTVTYS